MAATATLRQTIKFGSGQNGRLMELADIVWTGTTATVEYKTKLSVVEAWTFARAGTADGVNAGILTLDETVAADGRISVASNAITIDRHKNDPAGTLAGETFSLILIGY